MSCCDINISPPCNEINKLIGRTLVPITDNGIILLLDLTRYPFQCSAPNPWTGASQVLNIPKPCQLWK